MIITNTINSDLWIWERTQEIHAVQGDSCTRKVTVKLFANREPFVPEADVSVVIRYHKPDGTGGSYDTLPDGEKAWELTDNAVSFILAPQMLTVPGRVAVQVEMLWEDGVLASFPLHILVEENVAAGATSSGNYFSWEQRLEGELIKTLEQAKQSGKFTGATPQLQIGTVSTLNAGEMAAATIHGTPEYPVLDLALPRGADAAVDATLAVSGSAADAAAVGTALAGKAPSGYGLGRPESMVTLTNWSELDAATASGWYKLGFDTWFAGEHLVRVDASDSTVFQTFLAANSGFITVAQRAKKASDSQWGELEWLNPPMAEGEEYRTAERYKGKVVWTRLFKTGAIVNGGSFTFKTGAGELVRYSAKANGYALPYYDGGNLGGNWSLWCNVSDNAFIGYMGPSIPAMEYTAQVWYTKE